MLFSLIFFYFKWIVILKLFFRFSFSKSSFHVLYQIEFQAHSRPTLSKINAQLNATDSWRENFESCATNKNTHTSAQHRSLLNASVVAFGERRRKNPFYGSSRVELNEGCWWTLFNEKHFFFAISKQFLVSLSSVKNGLNSGNNRNALIRLKNPRFTRKHDVREAI